MSGSGKIITRIAPSPTGNLHIGTARTALFNYLFAKKMGGTFLVRVEDTDKERSTKEFEKNILDGLEWLGLNHDEIYRQSERTEIYKKYLEELIASNKAYISREEVKEEGQRSEVIRFRNPNSDVTFHDIIRGDITFNTTELGDFVIAKSLTEPVFHFAVVVDDHEMGISHVIRGEDHLSNTSRQILIQQAIGAKQPIYAHLPLILAPDRSKLSKRHGAVSLDEYREKGYLKEAIINYLALLGWNSGTDQEIFTLDELISNFSIEHIQKSGAIFNEEKLKWFNREYLKKMDRNILQKEISDRLQEISNDRISRMASSILDRISTLKEISELNLSGEFDYAKKEFAIPMENIQKILWHKNSVPAQEAGEAIKHLSKIKEILDSISDEIFLSENAPEKIKEAIWPYAEAEGKGNVLWPFRYALSGKDKSPDPFELSYILGKEVAIERLEEACKLLES